jgi:hypothetical protein
VSWQYFLCREESKKGRILGIFPSLDTLSPYCRCLRALE